MLLKLTDISFLTEHDFFFSILTSLKAAVCDKYTKKEKRNGMAEQSENYTAVLVLDSLSETNLKTVIAI